MDEEPEVDDVTDYFTATDVVVVPLFIADGFHTQEDIPEDMGLTDDYRTGYPIPAEVDGHRIWYAGAVGTEGLMAEVVLERALDAGADVSEAIEFVRERTRRTDADADSASDDADPEVAADGGEGVGDGAGSSATGNRDAAAGE
jgi:sirohydrochlorin cobaltochelatase